MISGFSSNREEFCSKTWYPTMKKLVNYSWKEDRSLSVENSKQGPGILSGMWKQVFWEN